MFEVIKLLLDIIKLFLDLNIFNKANTIIRNKDYSTNKNLEVKTKKLIKRRLKAVFYTSKKDNYGLKCVDGVKLLYALNSYIDQEKSIEYIQYWKDLNYLKYTGIRLEPQTKIKILSEEKILESFNSC